MDNILKTITTLKGEYFIIKDDNGKLLFKKHLTKSIENEVNGYNSIKDIYNVPKLLSFDFAKNEIIYEYNDNLYNKTLHKGLFGDIDFDMNKIINSITQGFEHYELLKEDISTDSCFFQGRVPNVEKYLNLNSKSYNKIIICNQIALPSFKMVVKNIINGISKNQTVPVIISQGDPTDLNISINGMISDFEVSGKNSLINEIAIFIGCYVVNCYYYYIKYINSPHKYYTDTLKNMSQFINCDYKETKNAIFVNFSRLLPHKIKEFILTYLYKIKSMNIIDNDFLIGPYIAMRMISPINIDTVNNEKDKYLLFSLAGLFEQEYNTLDKIIEFITKF